MEGAGSRLGVGDMLGLSQSQEFAANCLDESAATPAAWPLRVLELVLTGHERGPDGQPISVNRAVREISAAEILGPRFDAVSNCLEVLAGQAPPRSPHIEAATKDRCDGLLAEHVRRLGRREKMPPLRIEWLSSWRAVAAWPSVPSAEQAYDRALVRECARAFQAGTPPERALAHAARVTAGCSVLRARGPEIFRSAMASYAGGPGIASRAQELSAGVVRGLDPLADELTDRLCESLFTTMTESALVGDAFDRLMVEVAEEMPNRFLDEGVAAPTCRLALVDCFDNWRLVILHLLQIVMNRLVSMVLLPPGALDPWEPLADMLATGAIPLGVRDRVKYGVFAQARAD